MVTVEGVKENFKFIVLEVKKQLRDTLEVVDNPQEGPVERIYTRDDYIDNLKSVVEDKCFSYILGTAKEEADKQVIAQMRAVNIIAGNLEKIADYSVNIIRQIEHYSDDQFIKQFNYQSCFKEIFKAMRQIVSALQNRDTGAALNICRSEFELDRLHNITFKEIMAELPKGKQTGDLVTTLFIFRYLERVGDALLNIGEAIIFAIVGEKLKIHQYQALEETLAITNLEVPISEADLQSFWAGRSGCRIGKLHEKDAAGKSQEVIFKEGKVAKISKEKENIERWEKLIPGIPPQIFGFHDAGENASILVECLTGTTLQQIILDPTQPYINRALEHIKATLNQIWSATKKSEKTNAFYIKQLMTRLKDVYQVHPSFNTGNKHIGDNLSISFSDALKKAYEIDQSLDAPFSVFIHGDFNTDNVIYNHREDRIHFIDVHRSREMDYVQDISVCLISNFRLPIFDKRVRNRINHVIDKIYEFAYEFAKKNDDAHFEARLTLGLIRSFITSTRFELNHDFAQSMFMRAIYLLERITEHTQSWEDFRLPKDVLAL